MKCLIVVSHPLRDSLCEHLAEQVIERLSDQGHEVHVEKLYESGFGAALNVAERSSYYAESYDFSDIEPQVQRLLEAEALVLVYPTWWFGFPAMLKGWFDRVWGPGLAYDHADDLGPIRPRLTELRQVLVVTTLGSPWWVDRLVLRQPLRRVLKLGILGACSRGVKLRYLSLYAAENIEPARLARFEHSISRVLDQWR